MTNKCFDKKSVIHRETGTNLENQKVEELYKPIIKKFEKRKRYSSFKNKICCAGLADMQLINKNMTKEFDFCYVLLTF